MSESRQRFTGRVFSVIFWVGFLWGLFVTLPLFGSNLQVTPTDPRWMTPADLTWRRIAFNLLSKPGFRWITVMISAGLIVAVKWNRRTVTRCRQAKREEQKNRTSFSLEWVMDGAKKNSLAEYGSFVGVI